MSREIKIRLYSKPAKRYIDYITVGFLNTGELRSYSTENGVGPVLDDDYIVEQYTGLKDKNGKEICEGDIFRNSINGGTWRVCWNEKYTAFWVDSGVAGCSLGEFDWDRSEREYGFIRKNCEVIGNIHENKELLGGKK